MASVPCAVLSSLVSRGIVKDSTTQSLSALLKSGKRVAAYAGFDPTATSLHVGNLAVMVALQHLAFSGFDAVWLVGGMTGSIGDPSGKSTERPVLGDAALQLNVAGISNSIAAFTKHSTEWVQASGAATHVGAGCKGCIVDNAAHYEGMGVASFFRDVGRHMRVSSMLSRESVAARMRGDGDGVSLTELTYQAFQAYDFAALHRSHNAVLQVGGSDQWGNICAGIDLTHRLHRAAVHGVTVPLLTTKAGQKFGKSEGNAVWLNPDETSHYEFFQYMMGVDDDDVGDLLRRLTLLQAREIDTILMEHKAEPEARKAQRALAEHTTLITRGRSGLQSAAASTDIMFGGANAFALTLDQLKAASALGGGGVPCIELPASEVVGKSAASVAAKAGLAASVSEGKRLQKSGGLYVNGERAPNSVLALEDLLHGQALLLRSGKRKHCIVFLQECTQA